MRPQLASRLRATPVDCDRWTAASPTDAGPIEVGRGLVDRAQLTFAGDEARFERALDLVLRYRMFPPSMLLPAVCDAGEHVAPGITVVQRIFVGPMGVDSGVRVTDLFDQGIGDGRRAGFECVTLKGHPERGVERFSLTVDRVAGQITFAIDSRSALALPFAWLGAPLARAIQRRAMAAALAYVRDST